MFLSTGTSFNEKLTEKPKFKSCPCFEKVAFLNIIFALSNSVKNISEGEIGVMLQQS